MPSDLAALIAEARKRAQELAAAAQHAVGIRRDTLRNDAARLDHLADALEEAGKDSARYRRFSGLVLQAHRDELCDVDGGDVQEWATNLGLLHEVRVVEPCDEACRCAEYGDFPQMCLRNTDAGRAAIDAAQEVRTDG